MKLFDFIGLKNFRVFDDQTGILEELSSVNLLTGTNNSGKSSIIKSLQMLKNSATGNKTPFDLDLTEQQHLLGDFDNILSNLDNKNIEVSLPFPFLGITTFYARLSYQIPDTGDKYKAYLRTITIIDKKDNEDLFSFAYRKATREEINADMEEYEKERDSHIEDAQNSVDDSEAESSFLPPGYIYYSELAGHIDWKVNAGKLRTYLAKLLKFYKYYQENKKDEKILIKLDSVSQDTSFVASIFINSLKDDNLTGSWTAFLKNDLKGKTIIEGSRRVNQSDFDEIDYFIPPFEVEELLYHQSTKILDKNLPWKNVSATKERYSIITQCFENSYKELVKKISSIHYLSSIKEENSRIYIGTNNSPFINLLKDYSTLKTDTRFLNKYLKIFEIGKEIKVDYQRKYQVINVSVISGTAPARDLVDFGYGIKQLILLLMQISVIAEKNRMDREMYYQDGLSLETYYIPSLLIIEEPETNLHPKWQSVLADMFLEASTKYNIQLLIETHSEYLIRKFQTLTAQGKSKSRSIKIFYLRNNQKANQERKQLETVFIEQDGSIDYRIFDGGFFDESHNLKFSLLNIQRDHFFSEFEALKEDSIEDSRKIEDLQIKIDDFIAKADVSIYQQIVSSSYESSKLLANSLLYLTSGYFLLKNINAQGDYSPVIIQFGRTVEYELIAVFRGFSSKKWSFSQMQGSLEKFKRGTTAVHRPCTNGELNSLRNELQATFNTPTELKIELLNYLRVKRNEAAHPGSFKSENDATDYISKTKDFLLKWIELKK